MVVPLDKLKNYCFMRTDIKNFPRGVDSNQLLYLIYQAILGLQVEPENAPVHFDLGDQSSPSGLVVSQEVYDAIVAACSDGLPVTASFHINGESTIHNAPVVYASEGNEHPIVMTPEMYYGDISISVETQASDSEGE